MKERAFWLIGKSIIIIGILIFMSGCAPMMAQVIYEDSLEDSNSIYSSMKASLPPPEEGKGRLFVYLTTGGPTTSWVIGVGPLMKGFFTIDDAVYSYLGGSYFYVDLPAGSHTVTVGEVMKFERREKFLEFDKFQRGKNRVEIDLENGDEEYVRIDLTGAGAFTKANLVVVARKTASEEIASLRMAKEYKTEHTIAQ